RVTNPSTSGFAELPEAVLLEDGVVTSRINLNAGEGRHAIRCLAPTVEFHAHVDVPRARRGRRQLRDRPGLSIREGGRYGYSFGGRHLVMVAEFWE
ncbi:MAG: hypothetical protein ACXWZU_03040, partial [Actinomycetota bacterium]